MTTAMANEYVGVKEGDWFEYSWTYWGNATEVEDKNVWTKITVEEINGTEITFKWENRFEDGQEQTDTFIQDVITGNGSLLSFVRTDLDVGDLIYTEGELMGKEGLRINETIQRTYLGTPIEVVHLNYSETKPLGIAFIGPNGTIIKEPEGPLYTLNQNLYWERRTGVLQETSCDYN